MLNERIEAHRVAARSRVNRARILIGIGVVLCYAVVLLVPFVLPTVSPFSRTFNSMLDHLLRGRADVDPAIIGGEGFAHDGRVYAYWGPIPAILRLPITVLPQWRSLNFTIPYCAVALFWMGVVKIWTLRYVLANRSAVSPVLARSMYIVIILSGAQMCFLRFSLYQEVCLWAGLFSAIFVAAAIVGQQRGYGERERLVMAFAAGATLLTRVSTGIGVIVAFGLLLGVELLRNRSDWRRQCRISLLPSLVLMLALGATAWVNYARWGNILTFADYTYYLFNAKYPDRVARTARYGLFNIARLPFGIVYYFAPVWVLPGGDGRLMFDAMRYRLVDSAELPPSSFLATDPLLLFLGCIALRKWCGERGAELIQASAIVAGLAIPPLLMLTAISMCFRYRIDFYPIIEFLAFSGLALIDRTSSVARSRTILVLAGISVFSSIVVGIAYIAGRLGPGQLLIGDGIGRYYLGRLGLI